MNITQERIDDLNAVVKVEISVEDYEENVNKVLKDYQKKSNIPGFRPGKVPIGLIKKQYGTAVTLEEINKILSESLTKYITDNKLNILGNPLPNEDKKQDIDVEKQKDYEFYFDIGLAPAVDLELSENIKVDYYTIIVEDKVVDKYFDDIRKKYGTPVNPDTTEEGDVVKGDILEIDEEGKPKGDGIQNETSISIDLIKDKNIKKKFIDVKTGTKIIFNPLKATDNATETAAMLGVVKEKVENLKSEFEFKINEISRIEPAEVNEEFYKKVYPQDEIKDEKAFRERIRKDAQTTFAKESDSLFVRDVSTKLIEITAPDLPDDFLKRWLLNNNEKITKEQIDKEYDNYAKSLKWQLVENKLIKDHNLEVAEEDIRNHVKEYLGIHMFKSGEENQDDEQMNKIVDMVLQNEEESKKITDQLMDKRLFNLFKSTVKIKNKEVTYDEFIKLVTDKNN
ncbi:trigger factor [Bacteroidota bacterium]